jgi:sulfate adenylyltransferase
MTNGNAIAPHGGVLIDRILKDTDLEAGKQRAQKLKTIQLDDWQVSDLEMIAVGAFSPLDGFMGRDDYESVVEKKHLAGGLPWTIPITLGVSREVAHSVGDGEEVALGDSSDQILGILQLNDRFSPDKEREALKVFATADQAHPGVRRLYSTGDVYLSGKITLLERPDHSQYKKYWFDPNESRQLFQGKGWKRIVGFQTRNPVHRAHEYLQKCALEMVDGLFLHPLVGETKSDDIPTDVRMRCYEVLLENYYPKDRVVLGVYPAAMRYAGPREAILHAIVRKNYGCTHFIVGRDHAGVGNYYGSFDAHRIFEEFEPSELAIIPLFFDNAFYCQKCRSMASTKTCPHAESDRLTLSGTQVRSLLREGKPLPVEFTRPEVADILRAAMK